MANEKDKQALARLITDELGNEKLRSFLQHLDPPSAKQYLKPGPQRSQGSLKWVHTQCKRNSLQPIFFQQLGDLLPTRRTQVAGLSHRFVEQQPKAFSSNTRPNSGNGGDRKRCNQSIKNRKMRTLLTDLYPEKARAIVLISDAHMELRAIDFEGAPSAWWHSILAEADRQGDQCINALLNVVKTDYPTRWPEVQAAIEYRV